MHRLREDYGTTLAYSLTVAAALYVVWKITQSPEQALQFTFNGLAVGAVYALIAIGFTLVYSTVWFFDLYYGAAAALGAYGVFYLRSFDTLGGRYEVNEPILNAAFALVTAGVAAWTMHEAFGARLRQRGMSHNTIRAIGGVVGAAAGIYMWFVLTFPAMMTALLSPAVGVIVAVVVCWLLYRAYRYALADASAIPVVILGAVIGCAIGAYIGSLILQMDGAGLYLSWAVSCLLAGIVGLALYRGLYVYMRERARSPLVMLVASLGILLAMTAFTTIIFQSAPRPLPEAFGSAPWNIAGANLKGFNVFAVGVAIVGFLALLFVLKWTTFGKAVRAIGDDEEVSKVVGINTTVVIAIVFFVGAVYAALGGILSGHDTAIQPRMGLLLLLKGWIASVVGGIGNLYGALLGGFVLGMIEQFGIWDLAGEWKDAISFVLLILFLSFWPNGILPRR
ncbi:MAG: branched-chain amino acid ABC transporter permease [Chloroflexota bacterium]|nr:branched-chain amino acid ABC transporter permease [Chloroflexota bacterium]MDE2686080.1 branched-chain amino acid ABC transporter permease [Chloroflexota bacterium]